MKKAKRSILAVALTVSMLFVTSGNISSNVKVEELYSDSVLTRGIPPSGQCYMDLSTGSYCMCDMIIGYYCVMQCVQANKECIDYY